MVSCISTSLYFHYFIFYLYLFPLVVMSICLSANHSIPPHIRQWEPSHGDSLICHHLNVIVKLWQSLLMIWIIRRWFKILVDQNLVFGEISSDLYRASRCDGEKSTFPPVIFTLKLFLPFIYVQHLFQIIYGVGSQTFRKPMVAFSIYVYVTPWRFFYPSKTIVKLCN